MSHNVWVGAPWCIFIYFVVRCQKSTFSRFRYLFTCQNLLLTTTHFSQYNRKHRTLVHCALRGDAAAHSFNLCFGQEQAYAFAVFALVKGFIETKQFFFVAGHVNALAIVFHREHQVFVYLKRFKMYSERAFWRAVLNGIRKQIQKNALHVNTRISNDRLPVKIVGDGGTCFHDLPGQYLFRFVQHIIKAKWFALFGDVFFNAERFHQIIQRG